MTQHFIANTSGKLDLAAGSKWTIGGLPWRWREAQSGGTLLPVSIVLIFKHAVYLSCGRYMSGRGCHDDILLALARRDRADGMLRTPPEFVFAIAALTVDFSTFIRHENSPCEYSTHWTSFRLTTEQGTWRLGYALIEIRGFLLELVLRLRWFENFCSNSSNSFRGEAVVTKLKVARAGERSLAVKLDFRRMIVVWADDVTLTLYWNAELPQRPMLRQSVGISKLRHRDSSLVTVIFAFGWRHRRPGFSGHIPSS